MNFTPAMRKCSHNIAKRLSNKTPKMSYSQTDQETKRDIIAAVNDGKK
jgi:hypothetical protein